MILATHNSLSGYEPNNWLMKLINPFTKCQSLSIKEQWDLGVRMFDIRVSPFTGNASHGLVNYNIDIHDVLRWLDGKAKSKGKDKVYIRLCCENNMWQCIEGVTEWFEYYFKDCEQTYKNLHFCGGYIKTGWTKIITCKDPEYVEMYRTFNHWKSQKTLKDKFNSIWNYIKHPIPKYWAEKNNKKYLELFSNYNGFVMLDYIEFNINTNK